MDMLGSSPFQFATSSPSDVRHHYVGLSFYLVSFIVVRRKFCCSLSVATRVQRSERATHTLVYCRCPTTLNVLSHVVISLASPSVSPLAALVNGSLGPGNISIAVGREPSALVGESDHLAISSQQQLIHRQDTQPGSTQHPLGRVPLQNAADRLPSTLLAIVAEFYHYQTSKHKLSQMSGQFIAFC
jgi:hypothetical protein